MKIGSIINRNSEMNLLVLYSPETDKKESEKEKGGLFLFCFCFAVWVIPGVAQVFIPGSAVRNYSWWYLGTIWDAGESNLAWPLAR